MKIKLGLFRQNITEKLDTKILQEIMSYFIITQKWTTYIDTAYLKWHFLHFVTLWYITLIKCYMKYYDTRIFNFFKTFLNNVNDIAF